MKNRKCWLLFTVYAFLANQLLRALDRVMKRSKRFTSATAKLAKGFLMDEIGPSNLEKHLFEYRQKSKFWAFLELLAFYESTASSKIEEWFVWRLFTKVVVYCDHDGRIQACFTKKCNFDNRWYWVPNWVFGLLDLLRFWFHELNW